MGKTWLKDKRYVDNLKHRGCTPESLVTDCVGVIRTLRNEKGLKKYNDLEQKLLQAQNSEEIVNLCIGNMESLIKSLENSYCKPCKQSQCNYCPVYGFLSRYAND